MPVVNYKKFIRACKNCINLLINVIRTGNFLNYISNFFLFRATFEQLLCFLASNFLVLASNFLGFYEHNRAMPTAPPPPPHTTTATTTATATAKIHHHHTPPPPAPPQKSATAPTAAKIKPDRPLYYNYYALFILINAFKRIE